VDMHLSDHLTDVSLAYKSAKIQDSADS